MRSLYEELIGTYHKGEDGLLYPDPLPPTEIPTTASMAACTLLPQGTPRGPLHWPASLRKLNAHLNEIDEAVLPYWNF